jgi:hypothetical protein
MLKYLMPLAGTAIIFVATAACASPGSSSSANDTPAPPTNIQSSAFATVSQPNAAGSPSAASSSPAAPGMLSQGQSSTLSDSSNATIGTLTVSLDAVTTQSADGSGNSPVNGWFVVMEVKAAADPSYTAGWPVYLSDFYALVGNSHYDEGNGNAFDALTSGQQNTLDTTLAAGETTTGWISFDVPSRHGEIVYAPNSNGQPVVEWSY